MTFSYGFNLFASKRCEGQFFVMRIVYYFTRLKKKIKQTNGYYCAVNFSSPIRKQNKHYFVLGNFLRSSKDRGRSARSKFVTGVSAERKATAFFFFFVRVNRLCASGPIKHNINVKTNGVRVSVTVFTSFSYARIL